MFLVAIISSNPSFAARQAGYGDHASLIPHPPKRYGVSREIGNLQDDILHKESIIDIQHQKIALLEAEIRHLEMEKSSPSPAGSDEVIRRRHEIQAVSHIIMDKGRDQQRMGTRGSVCTANALEAIQDQVRTHEQMLAEKFLKVFQSPSDYIPYISSEEFGIDLAAVCQAVGEIFQEEPRCVFLQSPVYVFGDIHGNLEDLHFFADNIWKLGMDLTAGKFLFLGDYVDRGQSSLECLAYLFGLKLLYPSKIHLLRGNHETRDVSSTFCFNLFRLFN